MSDKEKKVLAMYDALEPDEAGLIEPRTINHVILSLLLFAVGVIVWLCVALANAENQRNAVMTGQCRDKVFPASLDSACMAKVESRDHWWQHIAYAMAHPQR